MRRRNVLSLGLAAIVGLGSLGSALAQDATPMPAGGLNDLGLPELTITADESGLHLDQTEIPAGRYLVSLNDTVEGGYLASGFVRLGEGQSTDDLSLADESAAGTPIMEQDGAPPPVAMDWLYEAYIASGPSRMTPQVVVDLPAGDYGIWHDDPGSVLPVERLTVTGDADPAAITAPEPEAAVTIEQLGAGGEGFHFTVDGEFQAGPQVVKIVNTSDQPHFTSAFQYPEPLTVDQLMGAMMFDPTSGGTPPPDAIDFSLMQGVAYVSTQSSGTTTWAVMDVQPGQVGLECWIPDPLAGDIPHALEGMIQLFDVAG
ncbi:MAG: hypothetical protein M3Z20_13645 [Chloroflexota bacterium]|nr:hypothetical protein [Chloroflexota bacterium]